MKDGWDAIVDFQSDLVRKAALRRHHQKIENSLWAGLMFQCGVDGIAVPVNFAGVPVAMRRGMKMER